jgi:hypothetical protein
MPEIATNSTTGIDLPILKLPGGTDTATMALFAASAMPDRAPDSSGLQQLERDRKAIRFDTGADGGYLLYAYVDDEIPAGLRKHCNAEGRIDGVLDIPDGRIAFGGAEACVSDYAPNRNIRSDGIVPPGTYSVTAFLTDIPEDQYQRELVQLQARTGTSARILRLIPRVPILLGIPALFYQVVAGTFWKALAVGLGAVIAYRLLAILPPIARARSNYTVQKVELDMLYPSIVVEMRRR